MPKDVAPEVEVAEVAPLNVVAYEFGREDLNALRDAVNALVERANAS